MRHLRILLSLLLLTPVSGQEKDSVVEAVIKEGKQNPKVMSHLDHLVNKIGPRLTSSKNLQTACEWTRDKFKEFGIENARLEKWGSFEVGFDRGPWSGSMTAPRQMNLVCNTRSWSAGTNGPVEGRALLPPANSEGVDDKYKGAWVLLERRRLKSSLRKALNAKGVAGYVTKARGELLVTSGNASIRWDNLPTTVSVQLKRSDFTRIAKLIKDGTEVKLKFDIQNKFVKGPIPLFNVIADIKGTEKPDEIVIVGGHIDSWDGATGAVDNGTGVATTLEAARFLMKAGARPKRTIRFMLWSGEEQGLFGSRAWVRQNPDQLKNISCVLVHDGGTNYLSGIVATRRMKPIFEKAFAPVMTLNKNRPFRIREVARLPYGIGSDHDSFLSAGVPGFFWRQSGRANYFKAHHTQHDKFEQAVPEYQRHSAMVVAIGAWNLANADTLLPREGLPRERSRSNRMLGVNLESDGVTVSEVMKDSAAEKAGIKTGDKILQIGDTKIKNRRELERAKRKAKKETTITVLRQEKKLTLLVTFKE